MRLLCIDPKLYKQTPSEVTCKICNIISCSASNDKCRCHLEQATNMDLANSKIENECFQINY